MGAIISGVKSVIGFSAQVKAEKDREANRARQKAASRLKNPIPPPFFYKSITDRDKAEARSDLAKGGAPYSTKSIRSVLPMGILPVGYSEEQLTAVGFGPEVKAFARVLATEDAKTRRDLGKLIDSMADELENVPDLTALGVSPEDIQRLRDTATKAKAADASKPDDFIDVDELTAVLDRIKALASTADGAQKAREDLSKLDTQVAQAAKNRTDAVVDLARRAFAPRSRAARAEVVTEDEAT